MSPASDPQTLFEIIDNFGAFVSLIVGAFTLMGAWGGGSATIGAFSGYLVFVYIAVQTGDTFLLNIMFVTLVLVTIGTAFKFWRLEGGGSA